MKGKTLSIAYRVNQKFWDYFQGNGRRWISRL